MRFLKRCAVFLLVTEALDNVLQLAISYKYGSSPNSYSRGFWTYLYGSSPINGNERLHVSRKEQDNYTIGEEDNTVASPYNQCSQDISLDCDSENARGNEHSSVNKGSSIQDINGSNHEGLGNEVVTLELPQGERYDPLKNPSIHERLLEGREYQLHIPPIANFKPPINRCLTRPDVYAKLSSEPEEGSSDYVDGPLNLHEMVERGEIQDFRHSTNPEYRQAGESEMLSWMIERPPDVFIINWSGVVHMGYRDGVVTAAKALLNIADDYPREIRELLTMVAVERKLPVWLSTRARYAQPFIDTVADWIPVLYFFLNNCNDKSMTDQDHRLKGLAETTARALDILKQISNGGNPNDLVDMGKEQRDEMGIVTHELDEWKSDNERYNNMQSTYEKTLQMLGVAKDSLMELYQSAWKQVYDDREAWLDAVKYRTQCGSLNETQQQKHEAFNCAVVSAIKHHIEVYKLPVYLVSDFKPTSMILKEAEALGIHLMDDGHAYGIEKGSVVKCANSLLHKLDLDHRVPVHYFDDRMKHLEEVNHHEELGHVRAYFVDWGRSTYDEKLRALYDDNVKYVKNSSWLVNFMATPSTQPGREWTHGYRLRTPDEEVYKSVMDWKKRWHKEVQITEQPQRPCLKVV